MCVRMSRATTFRKSTAVVLCYLPGSGVETMRAPLQATFQSTPGLVDEECVGHRLLAAPAMHLERREAGT